MSKTVRVWANIGTILAAFWLMTFLVPEARTIMLDVLASFLLGLWVTLFLWWTASRDEQLHPFWWLLAAGWTIALLGNIVWGAYEMLTGQPLPYISLVDVFYLARYALLFAAFIKVMKVPAGKQWVNLITVLGASAILALALYCASALSAHQSLTLYMAGAVYPILDMGLIYLALEIWLRPPQEALRAPLGLLALALVAYGIANWLNAYGHLIDWSAISGLASLFWPLSDALTGLALLSLPCYRANPEPPAA